MRQKLTYNYWLMIVAWGMFLNGYNLLANLFGLAACAVLSTINKRINHWRLCSVGLITYWAISFFLLDSNISYFFPKLSVFLATISLNCSLTNEYLSLLKSRFIVPYVLVMVISVLLTSIITWCLPNSSYSLFSKKSLYIMEALIFLPYLFPSLLIIIYKRVYNYYLRSLKQNKGVTEL